MWEGGDVGPDARPGLPIAIISASRAEGGRLDLPILGAMASASVLSVCPGMALSSLHATYTVMAYTSIAWMKRKCSHASTVQARVEKLEGSEGYLLELMCRCTCHPCFAALFAYKGTCLSGSLHTYMSPSMKAGTKPITLGSWDTGRASVVPDCLVPPSKCW